LAPADGNGVDDLASQQRAREAGAFAQGTEPVADLVGQVVEAAAAVRSG
jgi:hypothetical protein